MPPGGFRHRFRTLDRFRRWPVAHCFRRSRSTRKGHWGMAEGDNRHGVDRRGLLKTSGTAALFAAVQQAFPSGAFAAGTGPEATGATLGFIALTDDARQLIPNGMGTFPNYVLSATISKTAVWERGGSEGVK